MIRGLYFGASGMLVSQHQNDITADNLANVNTPGYKKDTGVVKTFSQELMVRLERGETGTVGNNNGSIGIGTLGIVVDRVTTGVDNGTIVQTGTATDLALSGPGFFAVNTPNGLRYTRSGNFQLDGSGNLVTSQGYQVMGTLGPIQGITSDSFQVLPDGTVRQDGKTLDRLNIVDFPQNALRKEGDNLFSSQTPPNPANNVFVKQNFLEQSNVDVAGEMGSMMNALRSYEANQKVIQTLDNTLEKASNEIGKL